MTWTAAVALVVAAVAGVALLLSDRRETMETDAYGVTRQMTDRVLAPVGGVIATPVRWVGSGFKGVGDYFFAASENRRLRAELAEMRQWRDVAVALRDTNDRYKALLGLKTDPPIPMVSARVVSDSRGPFANTRLANAGRERGVESGNPVMSEYGLVGRVIGVTEGVSRILLLTDVASRTPVMVDRTNARAILTGDGGGNPRLDYMRGQSPVKEGDRVITSGDGGVFPRGLPVGVAVKGMDGRWRVALSADSAPVDYVKILLFEDFTQLANQAELARTHLPPPVGPVVDPAAQGQTPGAAVAPTVRATVAAPAPPLSGAAPRPAQRPLTRPAPRPLAPPPAPARPLPPSLGAEDPPH